MLLVSVVAGVVLLNLGGTANLVGRVWLTLVAALYWCLSLPAVSSWLIARMDRGYGQVRDGSAAAGVRALVVFGNGSVHYTNGPFAVDYLTRRSVFAVFEAARVYALIDPPVVIATGGQAGPHGAAPEAILIRDRLVSCGVPAERILVEQESRTTEEQVSNVIRMLELPRGDRTTIAVTTSAHMPRVVRLFGQRGIEIVPSTTPELRYDEGATGWRRWWPSMAALTGSASAMYEHLASVRTMVSREGERRV